MGRHLLLSQFARSPQGTQIHVAAVGAGLGEVNLFWELQREFGQAEVVEAVEAPDVAGDQDAEDVHPVQDLEDELVLHGLVAARGELTLRLALLLDKQIQAALELAPEARKICDAGFLLHAPGSRGARWAPFLCFAIVRLLIQNQHRKIVVEADIHHQVETLELDLLPLDELPQR